MGIQVYKDVDILIEALAEQIQKAAKLAITERGQFNFVLSGGSSPQKLYELLASSAYKNTIDWTHTYFFFGDERFVPEEDDKRNSLMVKKALFDPLKISESHIFKVDTTGSPEESAQKYYDAVTKHFHKLPIEFDFILLGLGDNAHTASLFPNTQILKETEATVKAIFVEEVTSYRITMTASLINQAREIAFLVFGENKAEAVYHILQDAEGSVNNYPAKLIDSHKEKVYWFLDEKAYSLMASNTIN